MDPKSLVTGPRNLCSSSGWEFEPLETSLNNLRYGKAPVKHTNSAGYKSSVSCSKPDLLEALVECYSWLVSTQILSKKKVDGVE